MLRKSYPILILLILLSATGLVTAENHNTPIRFAILGDRTGSVVDGVYESIVAEIERMKPDFVMTVGDMIEGPVTDSAECVRRWEEYFKIVEQFSMPIHYTPGNNDIETKIMATMYQHYLGNPYYSFDVNDIHFTIIDNSRWDFVKDCPPEQLAWIKDDLRKAQSARYRLVFAHKPFWYNNLPFGREDMLHNILVENKVNNVFCGHFHTYFSAKYDSVTYTTFGSSGGGYANTVWNPGFQYGWVTIDDGGVHIVPIQKGATRPWDFVTVEDMIRGDKNEKLAINYPKYAAVDSAFMVNENKFAVNIKNFSTTDQLSNTISWDIPENWTVDPKTTVIEIAPLATHLYEFSLKNNGSLYPIPSLNVTFPYKDTVQEVNKTLSIARTANCYHLEQPPVIDGQIDEQFKKPSTEKLFFYDGTISTDDPVQYYLGYDDQYLYLTAYCQESVMDSIVANVKDRDEAVYTDDCVGFFFQPNPELDTVYQIYINPIETIYDQKIFFKEDGYYATDESWNGQFEVKCSKGADYWVAEAKLSLASLGSTANSGDKWRLNLRRKHQRIHSSFEWQLPFGYEPANFGYMVLE